MFSIVGFFFDKILGIVKEQIEMEFLKKIKILINIKSCFN